MRHRLLASAGAAVVGLLVPLVVPASADADTGSPVETDAPPKGDPEPEVAVSTTGSYIVVMAADPLVASIAPDDLDTPAAQAAGDALEAEHDEVLEDAGVGTDEKIQGFTNALNGFAATLSHSEAVRVASDPKVAIVLPDEMRQRTTDSSADFMRLTVPGGAYDSGLTGEGVIVGVIDDGIWPEHPSFADDGSYAAPPVTLDATERPSCEFGNTAHNPDDAPFTCNNKLIGARQMLDTYRALIGADPDEFDSARDDNGHGTHTASTAAGNAGVEAQIFGKDVGTISGIAPRAHVIAYKGLGNLGGFGSDLAAAIDQAVFDGVDVINYSVGGGASLLSADALSFLFAADAGVWVATSAGNSGPNDETIGGPADQPWITTVGASTQERFFEGTITVTSRGEIGDGDAVAAPRHGPAAWWDRWLERVQRARNRHSVKGASVTPNLWKSSPIVDAEFAGGDLCIPGTLDPELVHGKVVLCRRGAIARAGKSLAVYQAGGAGMVMYNNTDSDNLFTDSHWVPSVHIDYSVGVEAKEYIATHREPMATISRTATAGTIDFSPSMAYFSSRGENPSSADIIKPDITAPGVQILAGGSPFPDPLSTPPGELFMAISGTSMSSPQVAGYFALLKQLHPDWTPAMAKSAAMTTAYPGVRDSDRVSPAGPFDMGSGHLDPGRVDRPSSFNPGIVYDAGFNDYLGFLCDADRAIFLDADSTCAALDSLGVPTDASDLNYPSFAIGELAGTQTVQRTVTSVSDFELEWTAAVEAPDGYDVTVTPSSITLAPGETASYTVTIDNNGGGPIGEWRFGSLTWNGTYGHYARSPIAVRGAALDAPPAIQAEGTAGAASFDVQFGYTGDYTAAAHGPVPATVIAGDISQDPDQTYPSGDDGAGVDRIPISLSGAAFARWELVIDGPDDIDLFLEDSGGNIIAQSTAGGTDELIELLLPADGDYTMVVHGWSIPNDPLAYELLQWVVSATPGGDLSVDSAPAAAVTGASGTIEVSWAGLVDDQRYLGAVSHADAVGLLGLTLVEITTPPPPAVS